VGRRPEISSFTVTGSVSPGQIRHHTSYLVRDIYVYIYIRCTGDPITSPTDPPTQGHRHICISTLSRARFPPNAPPSQGTCPPASPPPHRSGESTKCPGPCQKGAAGPFLQRRPHQPPTGRRPPTGQRSFGEPSVQRPPASGPRMPTHPRVRTHQLDRLSERPSLQPPTGSTVRVDCGLRWPALPPSHTADTRPWLGLERRCCSEGLSRTRTHAEPLGGPVPPPLLRRETPLPLLVRPRGGCRGPPSLPGPALTAPRRPLTPPVTPPIPHGPQPSHVPVARLSPTAHTAQLLTVMPPGP
jgi:hypothetical protein